MSRMKRIVAQLPGGLSCREAEEFIDRYLDKELSNLESFKFRLHVAMCKECREYLRTYEAARALAKSAVDKENTDIGPMPDDLIKAILESRNPN